MPNFEELKSEIAKRFDEADSLEALNDLRIEYLGKKGKIADLMKQMKSVPKEEKREFGQAVNQIKTETSALFDEKKTALEAKALEEKLASETIDLTLPGRKPAHGNLNPLTLIEQELEDLFIGLGYQVIEGDEVVDDLYCFERANIPKDHPARDMQDSLYLDPEHLLRTHTTAIQMKVLEQDAPNPIKVVCPGKVYRRDDDDATHSHQFMQMEGLVIGEHVPLSDLKGTLEFFARKMFGEEREIRFRPSFFPFTEPSYEVDVTCFKCGGKGCNLCKQTGWIELLGSGMVHPNVLKMNGYDPEKYSGFAFGVGLDRLAMFKYGITDIRLLYQNDVRFLKQFDRGDKENEIKY